MNTKKPDSIYSLGFCTVATDVPTREKLKKAAEAAGMNLCEYMRYLASSVDAQGRLVKDRPAVDATLPAISASISMANAQIAQTQSLLNCLCEAVACLYCLPVGRGDDIKKTTTTLENMIIRLPESIRQKIYEYQETLNQGELEFNR